MPADLRAHARYPETLFRMQAEIYRTYHMLDPQSFYNKEDLWDLARRSAARPKAPTPVTPTYVMATLPGEDKPEFLLLMPFTPRNKDNLIGLMAARCDGPHLGEMVVLQLSKQELIFGPMQIAARINQDQTISKDLTLWNQQGSHVLRGQTLVLPVGNTFLYVDPIYIQATEASMPQLKKVVLAVGNRLIYADTYEQAPGAPLERRPIGPSDHRHLYFRGRPRQRRAHRRSTSHGRSAHPAHPGASGALPANWPRRATGPKRARNWRPSKRRRRSET